MNTHQRVFLLEPEQDKFPKFLIFADSEEDARINAASHTPAYTDTSMNNPYLNKKTKCAEVSVTIMDISPITKKTLHCHYNSKKYHLTKNKPELL
jgi:hypothetical protein